MGVLGEELGEALEPLGLRAGYGGVGFNVAGGVGGAELAEPDGGDVLLTDVSPLFGIHSFKTGGGGGLVEAGLGVFDRAVIVGGVDELVGDLEVDGRVAYALQVAAPPAEVIFIRINTFDEDEDVRIDFQGGVAGALGGEVPVAGSAAIPGGAGAGGIVGLVAEIHANDGGVVAVTLGEELPVSDPCGFGVGGAVPETVFLTAAAGVGTVIIEDHLEAEGAGGLDDVIEDLQRGLVAEVGVNGAVGAGEAYVFGDDGGFYDGVGEGDAEGVVAVGADGAEDDFVVLGIKAAEDCLAGFEAVPVDICDANRFVINS